MDHYVDIRLLPDPEFTVPVLMSALFGKLHRALAAQSPPGAVGVSFPRQRPSSLGDVLRLHGALQPLQTLMAGRWQAGLRDHAAFEAVRPVPPGARHRVVRRVQAKSNAARLRRRLMHRHDVSEAEARQRIPTAVEQRLDLPFLQLRSSSTGQPFRLFVEHGPVGDEPREGRFSSYGLSDAATVPWF